MENNATIVTDPRNREVYLPAHLCVERKPGSQGLHHLFEYSQVVETPACMIETADAHVFYFRSIGWNFTVLIETVFEAGRWTATGCLKNPDPDYISQLLRDGNFIAGESLN